MKWLQVSIKTTEEACEAVSEMLTSLGAGGVVIEDPNEIRRQLESLDSRTMPTGDPRPAGGDVTVRHISARDMIRKSLPQRSGRA